MSTLFRIARIACLAGGLTTSLAAGPAMAGDLTVNVGPDKSNAAGVLVVALFAAAGHWLKTEQAHALIRVEPGAAAREVVLRDLPPGRYALLAFVDVNGNGTLDKDADGKPIEPHGFSGDNGGSGPPDFDDAVIEVGAEDSAASITLK